MKRDYTAGELIDIEHMADKLDALPPQMATQSGLWPWPWSRAEREAAVRALRHLCAMARVNSAIEPVVTPVPPMAPKPPRKRPARAGGGTS
jgi:hypothetical protein